MCMDELKSYGKQKLREVYVWLGKLGGVADTQLDQRKQECLLREWLGRLMD
ncbi:unnamed protein product [Ostreobium quekettii]|uniref:Uncharacterized protein n=1 Tax=Ostreobium quekettii TaxID=121088 RepID=A0A8S1IUL7_9CHLO|nr:unnamed protein product [Ostreobium quekettii]